MMDSILVENVLSGDALSFDKLTEKYYNKLLFYVIKKVKNASSAQDIVQETFLKAFVNLKKLRDFNSFQYWIFSICRNEINRFFNNSCRTIPIEEIDIIADENDIDCDDDLDVMMNSLMNLKKPLIDVIIYKYFCNMTLNEIAALIDIPEKTVKSRLYEARKQLKSYITKSDKYETLTPQNLIRKRLLIMDTTKLYMNGAYVLSRLSLKEQVSFYRAVKSGEKLSTELLRELGQIKNSDNLFKAIGSSMTINEFAGIVAYCDANTAKRLMDEIDDQVFLDEVYNVLDISYDVETVEIWLNVSSVEETLKWYRDVLGWSGSVDASDGSGIGTFACIYNGNIDASMEGYRSTSAICLSRGEVSKNNSSVIFIIVSDINAIYDKAVELNANIIEAVKEQAWGMKTFEMTDNNAYRIRVAERI